MCQVKNITNRNFSITERFSTWLQAPTSTWLQATDELKVTYTPTAVQPALGMDSKSLCNDYKRKIITK